MKQILASLFVLIAVLPAFPAKDALTNAFALAEACRLGDGGRAFRLEAKVIAAPDFNAGGIIAVEDASGHAILEQAKVGGTDGCAVGDTVFLQGYTSSKPGCHSSAVVLKSSVLAHGPPPPARVATVAEALSGACDAQAITLTGFIIDAFQDEISVTCRFLMLNDGESTIPVLFASDEPDRGELARLVGARVSVTGLCGLYANGARTRLGRTVRIASLDDFRVLAPPPSDPFSTYGRQRLRGRVIAVARGGRRLLIRTADGAVSRIDLAPGTPPAFGALIEAAGLPETDLFSSNLSRAIWRPDRNGPTPPPEPDVLRTSPERIFASGPQSTDFNSSIQGRAMRLEGTVRNDPANGTFLLDCGRRTVEIDASSLSGQVSHVSVGCRLAVVGTCMLQIENWRPNGPFPHIEGFTLAVRTPDDIRILARPPWWTVRRLLLVICVLLAGIGATLFWTFLLKRLAERRGRELAAERAIRSAAEARTDERTRLAIELHDSIAQSLSGASMQIDAARKFRGQDESKAGRFLDLAASTLLACRTELRNCIWDLRNFAWEDRDFASAIRRTVAGLLDGAELVIRFNVPREKLSDNATHSVLRIIRELVSNAVRHGHARRIRIAGNLEDGHVGFSVQDDGCGFDASAVPGAPQGHFGLSGIRERVRRMNGRMELRTAPGKGTKVTVTL